MENIVENIEHLDNFTQQEYPMSTVEVVLTADATSTTDAVTTALALSCIIAVTVIGNVLVILSVFTYRPLRSVQNMLIVSLAVADITVALLVMPLNVTYILMGKWKFGLTMCKFWLTCDVLCCTASILNLCVIALDRYWAIHDPINYAQKRTLRRVLVMIALVWIVSILVSAPPLIGWNDWPLELTENSSCQLTAEKGFVIYSSICAFFIPLLIMTTVYVRIFKTAKQRIRKRAGVYACGGATKIPPIPVQVELNIVAEESTSSTTSTHKPPNEKNEGAEATQEGLHVFQRNARLTSTVRNFIKQKQKICLFKERRATRVLGIVMGVFVLCWLPFFLMYVIMPFCEDCYLSNGIVNFITWLGYVNSALNPVIYTVFNLDFRKALTRILCKKQ